MQRITTVFREEPEIAGQGRFSRKDAGQGTPLDRFPKPGVGGSNPARASNLRTIRTKYAGMRGPNNGALG
jgi:hypothetical protein